MHTKDRRVVEVRQKKRALEDSARGPSVRSEQAKALCLATSGAYCLVAPWGPAAP